ncbi:MAG: hypothetical protein QM647_06680 [Asticcacaulis sp.]|uniref:hypothetical protein n=1 Tax=Asticcacaulis sp. TaxID=1872648 RepID=UPI0039E4103D
MQPYIRTLMMAKPWDVFGGLTIVVKFLVMIMLVAGLVAAITAFIRRFNGGPRSGLLSAMGITALVCGVLGAAYNGLNSYIAYQMVKPVRFIVVFPSVIEATYVLMLGLIIWAISMWGNAGARRA